MNVLRILSKLKRSPKMAGIRRYTNLLYYDPNMTYIESKRIDYVVVDGFKFRVSDQINSIQRVVGNPWFAGVRPTDIVLDIGACIGAITIPLAKTAKKVYAVEPLYFEELEANVKLNGSSNVEVVPYAVGPAVGFTHVEFSSKRRRDVPMFPFSEFIRLVDEGRIDFLKMDGEGCEWDIRPEELKGIRELRIEFHIRRGRERECKKKYGEYLDWIRSEGYKVTETYPHYAPDPFDKEDRIVSASLV